MKLSLAPCQTLSTCVSGSYTEDGGACCVSGTLLYQDGAQFIQDAQSVYFQTRADVAWHGEWALAFRGSQGIGDSIYTEFLDTSRHDDHPVVGTTAAISCWSLSGSHSCSRHLRATCR
nr:hypothetical protein BaRGS_020499 [Batillaria attramentaria]